MNLGFGAPKNVGHTKQNLTSSHPFQQPWAGGYRFLRGLKKKKKNILSPNSPISVILYHPECVCRSLISTFDRYVRRGGGVDLVDKSYDKRMTYRF